MADTETMSAGPIARTSGSGLPVITPEQMVAALNKYRELQRALDAAMPESIMMLDGRPFRKKSFWRAVALAFHLDVIKVDEHREVSGAFKDGRDNFGWVVTYEARHQSGRTETGDGACFAVEKARRFKCPHPESEGSKLVVHFPYNTCPDFDPDFQWKALPGDATEHNVRSHANTRAYNRAVSNLVGFGEVSAEEVDATEVGHAHPETKSAGAGATAAAQQSGTNKTTTVAPDGATTVVDTQTKTGKTNNKEWTRYVVKFADGRETSTFDSKLFTRCEAAKATGVRIVPVIEETAKGRNLKDLKDPEPVVQRAPITAQPTDEPITGPEKILSEREVATPAGPRWVIQTEKRQVATSSPDLAREASEARKEKRALLPEIEIVQSSNGPINKLLKWVSAPWAVPAPPSNVEASLPGLESL